MESSYNVTSVADVDGEIKLENLKLASDMIKEKKETKDEEKNKAEIIRLLESEIAKRYYFQRAQYEMAAKHDDDVKEALQLFANPTKYNQLLNKK